MYRKSLSGRPYNTVVRISYVTLHKPLTALKLLPNQWNENNGVIITSVSETYIRIAFYNWTKMLTIPKFLLLFLSPFHELNIKQNKPFLFLYVERTAPIHALKKKILSNRQSWWIKIWKSMKTLLCLPGTPSPHLLALCFLYSGVLGLRNDIQRNGSRILLQVILLNNRHIRILLLPVTQEANKSYSPYPQMPTAFQLTKI